MIDLISALASWIAERSVVEWLYVAISILALAIIGMTVTLFAITRDDRNGDDGLDFYRPGDLDARYREHEGWF